MPAYKYTLKDEKTTLWYASFYYYDNAGKLQRKTLRGFKTQRDAKQGERDFLANISNSPTISFDALFKLYIEDVKTHHKQSTAYSINRHFKKVIIPFFTGMAVNNITPAIVRQWQNSLIEKEYAESSLRIYHGHLVSILNFAVKYHGLKENPCKIAGSIGKLKRPQESIKFWTMDEFKTAMSLVEQESMDYVIYNLLYFTGCRVGELLALTIADYNPTDHYIHISKTLNDVGGKVATKPKTESSNRTIYIPAQVCKILDDYIATLSLNGIYAAAPTDYLFQTTASTLREHLHTLCKKANVTDIRVHDLRHSHASLLINFGTPPLAISERLGHENVNITLERYSHLYPNKQENIVNNLGDVFSKCYASK